MPSKRPSPLEENPPSVSSSGSSSEEEDDSHGEEEELITPVKSSSKIPNSNSVQTPSSATQSLALSNGADEDDGEDDSTDDEDESGSDSADSTQNNPISTTSPVLDIKPISSKPMIETSKPKKPIDNSVGKRSLEDTEKDSRKEKKKKKVADLVEEDTEKKSGGGGGGDDSKKFQRLWTEQDEIDILKGMNNFKKTTGKDPSAQVGAFFEFLKNDLRSDVNKIQLQSKIRTLKRKYFNTLKRAKQPGEDPEIAKPHEAYVYKLSKKVWAGEIGKDDEGDAKSVGVTEPSVEEKNKKKSKNVKISDGPASCKTKVTALPTNSAPVAMETEDVGVAYGNPYLEQSFVVRNNSALPVVPPALGQMFSNRKWDLIESSNASELDKKWKKVMIAETEAYMDRLELVKEQTKLMLDKLRSF